MLPSIVIFYALWSYLKLYNSNRGAGEEKHKNDTISRFEITMEYDDERKKSDESVNVKERKGKLKRKHFNEANKMVNDIWNWNHDYGRCRVLTWDLNRSLQSET